MVSLTRSEAYARDQITAIVRQIREPRTGNPLAEVRALEADLVYWVGVLRKAAPRMDG